VVDHSLAIAVVGRDMVVVINMFHDHGLLMSFFTAAASTPRHN
jgi:hypothetical protein